MQSCGRLRPHLQPCWQRRPRPPGQGLSLAACGVVARAVTLGRTAGFSLHQAGLWDRPFLSLGSELSFLFFFHVLIKQEHRTVMSVEPSVTQAPSPSAPTSWLRLRPAGGGGWGHAHRRGRSVFTGLCNITTVSSRTFSSPRKESCARQRSPPAPPPLAAAWFLS